MSLNLTVGFALGLCCGHELAQAAFCYCRDVVEYVCDAAVIRADKVGILRVLADQFSQIPDEVIELLRQRFGSVRTADTKGFFPSGGFESEWLRLGSLLGALDEYETLQELLKLASNSVTFRRQEAAIAAAFVRVVDDSAILAMLLLLSRDSDSLVRATATRALLGRHAGPPDLVICPAARVAAVRRRSSEGTPPRAPACARPRI